MQTLSRTLIFKIIFRLSFSFVNTENKFHSLLFFTIKNFLEIFLLLSKQKVEKIKIEGNNLSLYSVLKNELTHDILNKILFYCLTLFFFYIPKRSALKHKLYTQNSFITQKMKSSTHLRKWKISTCIVFEVLAEKNCIQNTYPNFLPIIN